MWILLLSILVGAVVFLFLRKDSLPSAPAAKRPLLSENADSRLRGLERLRETALAQLDPGARARWQPRLDEIVEQSTKLLLMLDANRKPSQQRDAAVQQLDQLQDVLEEIAASPLAGRDANALDNRLIELKALSETLKS